MGTAFFEDILGQPAALRDLLRCYQSAQSGDCLRRIPRPRRVLLSGMGASFHAAQYGALLFGSRGIEAAAVEATELLYFGDAALGASEMLILISQSGASGEILPLLRRIPPTTELVAITNNGDSPLAGAAQHLLLQWAGVETTVATKTYLNTLACLWMLAQHWESADPFEGLEQTADAAQALIDARQTVISTWFGAVEGCEPLIFLGHGPHLPTARQAAMMLAEWAKLPALCFGIGAFRHGFIEIVTPRTGLIVFGTGGTTRESVRALLDEVTRYGARTLSIVSGEFDRPRQADFLAPLLDVIPAQLFAEQMARSLHVPPGFRYIQKVVRQL